MKRTVVAIVMAGLGLTSVPVLARDGWFGRDRAGGRRVVEERRELREARDTRQDSQERLQRLMDEDRELDEHIAAEQERADCARRDGRPDYGLEAHLRQERIEAAQQHARIAIERERLERAIRAERHEAQEVREAREHAGHRGWNRR